MNIRAGKKRVTGRVTTKRYRCADVECSHEHFVSTNHYGDIYSKCPMCYWKNPLSMYGHHVCLEEVPPDMDKPEPWKKVKLSLREDSPSYKLGRGRES